MSSNNQNKPNFFEIAPEELPQDGFITWLLQWAHKGNRMYDEKLNDYAVEFVKFLIREFLEMEKNIDEVKTLENLKEISVEAGRQRNKIDIWAKIDNKYLIIIEDKTFTNEHDNQLERYIKTTKNWYKENLKMVYIYLKTVTVSERSISKIKNFKYIDRSTFKKFFDNHRDIDNNIYRDFVDKIDNLDEAENAFKKESIKKALIEKKEFENLEPRNLQRIYCAWYGFYNELASKLKNTDWGKEENEGRSTCSLWWPHSRWNEYKVYFQIEQGDLCFKIGDVKKENRKEARTEWHDILMTEAKKSNIQEIKKPDRFGNGDRMTVAKVELKDWLGDENKDENEILNVDATIDKLKKYEAFFKKVCDNNCRN